MILGNYFSILWFEPTFEIIVFLFFFESKAGLFDPFDSWGLLTAFLNQSFNKISTKQSQNLNNCHSRQLTKPKSYFCRSV